MKKYIIFVLIAIVAIGGIVWYSSKIEKGTYSPFPLQEKTAEYTVSKSGNLYSLNYKRQDDNISVPIGNLPVDLEQFVGKKVLVQGQYSEDKPYCNLNCSEPEMKTQTVVKLSSISIAE